MKAQTQDMSHLKFIDTWLPWLTLRHFLPAASVRELCETMTYVTSGGKLFLSDLIDEVLGGGNPFAESWLIRPKTDLSNLGNFLLSYIRNIVWLNDHSAFLSDEELDRASAIPLKTLEFSFRLSACDFAAMIPSLPEDQYIQPGLKALYDVLSYCSDVEENPKSTDDEGIIAEILLIVDKVDPLLRTAIIKHVGDLYCDRDQWALAAKLYGSANKIHSDLSDEERDSIVAVALGAHIKQSRTTAVAMTMGYADALVDIGEVKTNLHRDEYALALSNYSTDEYYFRTRSSKSLSHPDTRGSILLAPLLSGSVSIENGLSSWKSKRFEDAASWFWSSLRRQTALGQLSDSKTTRAYLAACFIDQIQEEKRFNNETFRLAIGLLVESENVYQANLIQWSDDLVDELISEEICNYAISHANANVGVAAYRQAVVVALFSKWASKVPVQQKTTAVLMLTYLIDRGTGLDAELVKKGIDLNTCFKALSEICRQRPELRPEIQNEVSLALSSRLGNSGYWTGDQIFLKISIEFAADFSFENLQLVARSVLILLGKVDSSSANWIIVKPAIEFLGQESVAKLAFTMPILGREILAAILKFNANQSDGNFAADIIFALTYYPRDLLKLNEFSSQYRPLVKQALQKASTINASNALNNMMALLVSPKIAGRQTIIAVVSILEKLIDTAIDGKAALVFGQSYSVIRYLVARRKEIALDAGIADEKMTLLISGLTSRIPALWNTAEKRPEMFAPLSILRSTKADPVTVHNWVIASLDLADVNGTSNKIVEAIELAKTHPQLKEGISLGFATRHSMGVEMEADLGNIDSESRAAFYAALGRRLSAWTSYCSSNLAEKLLLGVLKHGPREVDAAVLSSIPLDQISNLVLLKQAFSEYEARIEGKRELSLTLLPLLNRWTRNI